jgi:hypothetical protein
VGVPLVLWIEGPVVRLTAHRDTDHARAAAERLSYSRT